MGIKEELEYCIRQKDVSLNEQKRLAEATVNGLKNSYDLWNENNIEIWSNYAKTLREVGQTMLNMLSARQTMVRVLTAIKEEERNV